MERVTEILAKLVRFRTITDGPNLDLIDWVQDLLAKAGFAVTRIQAPSGQKAGLLAKFGTGEGGVLYSAHSDVVPVEGQSWTSDPFILRKAGDRLIGRGATDMKGFLACVLAQAEQLRAHPPARPFMIALSWDEEIGCRGIPHMIDEVIPTLGRPDMVVVGEPTEMQLCTGHKGKAVYKAICHGEAGHSALAPQFQNALYLATDLINAIRSRQLRITTSGSRDTAYTIPYSTLHVGRMQGGVALNIVPERAEVEFEIRHLPEDNPKHLVATLRNELPYAIELTEVNTYPGLTTDFDNPLVQEMLRQLRQTQPIKVSFGTEAGYFSQAGLLTVVCGPGSMNRDGHKPNEGVETQQLATCSEFIRFLCLDPTSRPKHGPH